MKWLLSSLARLWKRPIAWVGAACLLWWSCQNPLWLLGLPCAPDSDCGSPKLSCQQGLCAREGAIPPQELILVESQPEGSQPEPTEPTEMMSPDARDASDTGTPERRESRPELSPVPEAWQDQITSP